METESNIPDDASAMSTTPEDKYSLVAKLDGIPNLRETAEAEDKQKGDKTTKITITSNRTEEDRSSVESSSPDKPSIETVDESSYCEADKIVNQPLKRVSENETEDQTGIASKDIEIGGHKIEVINDTNIEEYDLGTENEEVPNLTRAGEPNLKVHEQESSTDNSDSSRDQHASIEVISDTTEKQTTTSQTNEYTISKEKEDADLEYTEQATIISDANLGLINEVLIPNLELETKNLYKDNETVTESGVKDEDMDNKCTSHSITHVEDENKDTSLIGVQNRTAGMSYLEEGERKALESIKFSNNLIYDNDNIREDKPVHGKTEDSSKASQDTGINLSNDTEEQEAVPALYTGEKSDIEDGHQIIQEEAKEIEPATEKQLQETAAIGVPEQEAPSTVPTLAIVEDGTIEKTMQEKTHKEEESITIDDDKSYTPENEHEQAAEVLEEIDLLKTTSKVSAENEEHADQKSEAQSSENITTKLIDSDEVEKTENIQKSSYDTIEQEQTPELLFAKHREINDGGKIIIEEATGVPEVQTISPPPTIESVIVETSDKSIQEDIHKDVESAVTYNEEGQTHANEFEDKTNVLEAFELHEVNGSNSEENEKNAEPQSEASLDTIAFKHPDLQRLESTEINLSNDTEEQENVPPSGTGEKSEIKDDPQIIQEEAKEIGLATEKKLPETAIESVPNEDAPSITATATLAHVQSGTIEKTIQELRHEEEEPTPIDDEKSCTKENEHDQATEVLEAINLPETMSKASTESVEHADQKSEAQRSENVITKYVDSEEMVKVESIEKESHDVKEVEKSLELPSDEHQEINDSGKIIPEEVLGVPEDKTLQSLPVIASTIVESADKSIQEEIHKDVESAITYTEEGPGTEIEFEERTGVLEHRVDHKETENLQVPDIREKLEVKDGDEILQGEAKETEQGTKKQLPEAGIESVPEQEALSTVPTSAIVEDGTIEKTIQEQTYKEEESTTIDEDKSYTPENEHEHKVLEEIDLLKTTSKVSAENEENADQKSEAQSSENITTKLIDSDEVEKTESIQKSSYDIIEQEQNPELPSVENWEINDGGKIITEEATGVPEVQTIQPPPTVESVIVETFDKSIQEEINNDAKSAVTDTEEGQTYANDFEDKTNVLEAFELHEVNGSTSEENEKNADPQSQASLDTIALKHPDLQRIESTEINLSDDTEEQENVTPSGIGEKSEIKDDPQIIQEEAKEIEPATEKQLPATAVESVPEEDIEEGPRAEIEFEERTDVLEVRLDHEETENLQATDIGEKLEVKDGEEILQGEAEQMEQGTKKQLPEPGIESVPKQEALSTVPILAIVEDGTIEKTIQEQTYKEEESTAIDEDKSYNPENEHEQATEVLEEIDLLETTSKVSAENEHADQKSEAQSSENITIKFIDSDEVEKTESIQKSSYDIIEQEQSPELPSAENREINDGGKIITGEAIGVPEVQTIQPPPTIESVIVETFHKNIEEEIHKNAESAVTDTEEGQTRANEIENKIKVPEAFELHEVNGSIFEENEKNVELQSEASLDTIAFKHPDLQRLESTEINLSNDTEEQENVPPSGTGEKSEIKDDPQIIQEEAKVIGLATEKQLPLTAIESVPEEDAPSIVATATLALVQSGTIEKAIQERRHEEEEPTLIDDEKSCPGENEHDQATEVLEAINLPETTSNVSAESVEHADQKSEAQISESVITKHVDSEEMVKMENIEKESHDVKELEKIPELPSTEHQEINDGGIFMPEEVSGVPEQEALSTIAKLVTVEGGTVEKTIQDQTHEEKELILIDDNKSCTTENEHEKATNVIEAIDLPETLSKVSVENEENAHQKSKEQSSDGENWITNHIDLEEIVTTENIEKSSYDVKELKKTLELPSAENQDIDDGGKIMPEAAIGVPDGQTLQSLPPLASIGAQNVDRSIQEGIHIDGESAVTDTEEGKTHENELEDKTNSLEAFELHEVIANTNIENEKEVEPQSAASLETTVSIHPNFEGLEKTEINLSNDTEEQENVPESNTGEKLEIKDDPEIIQEEAGEKELATEIQLPETVTESVHEQEALSTVTSPEIVEGGTVEKTIQEQIHEEDQQKLTDDDRVCSAENEHEQATNVLEAIGLSETMSKDSAENEELANKSEAQSGENVFTKHINLEETGTTEDIEKSGYDVKDLENTPELPSVEDREINERGEIIQEEAIGGSEDQTLQPSLTTESVVVQTVDKSIQEEGQTHENEFEGKTNVIEAYDLHKVISSTTEENEKKAKPESEMSLESTVLKHSNLEGLGTTELKPGNDTDELENFLASDTVEKSDKELPAVENREIKESVKITPVEAIGVSADQTLPSLPTIASIGVETDNYSIPETVQKNSKSALSDTEEEQKQENEFEDKTNVLKEFKMDELIAITCEENDKKAEPEPEASIDTIVLKHPDLEVLDTTEVNLSNETEDQENVLASDTGKKLEIKDGPQIIHDEAKEIELATENQLSESATEIIVDVGTVEKTSPEQTHEEEESKPIDDEKSSSPENEYEQATKVVEAIDVPKTTSKANAENEIQKSEEQSIENVIAKHVDSEELVTLENIEKSSYDVKDVTPELPLAESQEINDCRKILLEEALGVPRDQTLQPLPSIASDGVKTGEESIQEEIHTHGESTVIDTKEGQTHQIESEDKTKVLEAFDLLDENACTSKENREKAELQSDASPDNTVLKHLNLEALDSTTKLNPSIDTDEPKNVSAPDTGEELEIKDYSHIIQEEAKGVELATERQLLDAATESVSEQEAQSTVTPLAIIEGGTIEKITQEQTHEEKDQTLQPLPTTESDIDETVDKSIEEEIHKYGESTVTDTEEGLTHENESVENVLEELDSHEVIAITNKEIEKEVESQSESILNTTALKHTSLEGLETIEVNPRNETEEPENVPVSDTGKKLEIKDGAKIIEEEENVMELATEKHLLEATTASINEQEDLLTPVIVESGTLEKLIQDQAHEEEESTPIDDNKSNTPEIKHEQESIVLEEIDLPKTVSTFSAENEEHADQKSEAQCSNVIAKHTDTEEMVTTECIEKSTYDVKLLDKTLELASAENREINDGEKITSQEEIGVPDNESLHSPPTIASGGVETADKNIRKETHKDNESAVTETEEEHRHENEYEGKTNVLEAFDLHEVIASTSEENEEKSEPKFEVSLDTVVLKHLTDPSLEGLETTEINKSIDIGNPENVPASYTGEKLEIKDDSEIIQEKAKEMELATEKLLPETTTKSVPEQEALSTMPTMATPEVGTLEKIIHEQTNEEEESTLEDDHKCYTIKNEHENETKVLKVIGVPETMSKVSAENEEHADQKSETQGSVNTITKHIDSEETITTESTETSNDVKEVQNISGVPQDQTLQPLPTIASVEEEIHKDDESSETSSREEKTHENKFEDNVKVLEESNLDKATSNTYTDNEKDGGKSAAESILEDEAQRVLVPTSEFVKGERIEKSFHEETLKEEQSTVTDNKLEQTTEVLEPVECITGTNFQAEPQREISVPGTNLVSLNQIEGVDLADVRKLESRDNSTTPNKDFSSSTIIDASEGLQRDESKNTLYGSSSIVSQEVEKESKAGSFNRVDIENICDKNDARTNENIEEQTIDNQVKDHNVENFDATESIAQREILDLSFENDPARKETAPRDSDKAIEKLEIQELETDQIGSAKGGEGEDEFEKISPSSSDNVMIKDTQDSDVKVSSKKHHGILSGVGSKVKYSISKVKKAITGKSSHSKTSSEK